VRDAISSSILYIYAVLLLLVGVQCSESQHKFTIRINNKFKYKMLSFSQKLTRFVSIASVCGRPWFYSVEGLYDH